MMKQWLRVGVIWLLTGVTMAVAAGMTLLTATATATAAASEAPVVTAAAAETQTATLTFGVVPQQAVTRMLREWTPLLRVISDETGVAIRFATAPNIPAFEQRVRDGLYDIAYMSPYHLTVFADDPGYVPLVRVQNRQIKGIIVVNQASTLTRLDELHGQTLAFPSVGAFAATLLTQASLGLKGIDFGSQYVGSHDAVYQAVAAGFYPAGGGIIRTFNLLDTSIKDQLRVLWTSPGYTPHAIAAHPRLSPALRQRLVAAFTELPHEPGIDTTLEALGMEGFIAAQYADWNDVRALHIQPSDR
ncbi:phosphate/phosphite/phosphonate ABC transporter substrate-binding protein [Oceanobacter sp. 5_MG-2023]|uniref:phosphate/phosphite/phosphonate ABC transporter substrate-binding protein n=1 Tax=Oceanobacter sp. 5_MG-2023 TaxID=3062645 RepID=UPI0026E305D0|nr:phosphate/phosphite/phosphonate ABC transporter substrate-binding protein [Oceanobacter sp. 5_MG-2023]MDO6681487.1 phosphate/phosphite/phosphonate ABC transporter substrate-binding protein [Oceanobacter sp. 5_MG-2023]